MNILFVNYGDFTSNSLNHIAGFAEILTGEGNACMVAVPDGKGTVDAIPRPQFKAALFEELLRAPNTFPDGRGADVIHAWTPRENVRKFVVRYQTVGTSPARLIVHLEDNEQHLLEAFTGKGFAALRANRPEELNRLLIDSLAHPLRHEAFLAVADGITYIVNTLRAFVPKGIPTLCLPPGVMSLYSPQSADTLYRRELGLKPEEKVIAYTGSVTFANETEVRDLYAAVARLNTRGIPTRLIRTGITPPDFLAALPEAQKRAALHLGFVDKTLLPKLLALSDVLVQPGRPNPFNDYRLPSKLPEFFAMGRPIILPATNVGRDVVDGRDALLLQVGSPEEIADRCEEVFNDPALAARLGEAAVQFARRHFDLASIGRRLAAFYTQIAQQPSLSNWLEVKAWSGSEISVFASRLQADERSHLEPLAGRLDLLERLIRELESSLDAQRTSEAALEREKQLTYWKTQYDLTKQHVGHIEQSLAVTRKRADTLESKLREAQAAISKHDAEALSLKTEISRLDQQIVQLGIQQRDLIYQRDEKIRELQESFSWKATAWLRALRRKLIDPRRTPHGRRAPLPPPPAHTLSKYTSVFGQVSAPSSSGPAFRYCLDYPQVWSFRPAPLVLRGWCFAADGTKISGLRARIGARIYPAVSGLKRLDVLAALREYPTAEYSGFKIDLDFRLGDQTIALEAADETGLFQEVFQRTILVSEKGGAEELTSYQQWAERFDTLTAAEKERQRAQSAEWASHPIISILVPVYNTPEKWLRKAINSVLEQTYPHWELCLADDASTAAHVRPLLESLAASDQRIKVVFRPQNGHISAASNAALEVATGKFVALLDHDDELAPNALFEVVSALQRHPSAELIYSDEDKIDEEGARLEPYFKPDYLPDLYLGQNYLSHLSVYRTATLRAVGGFRIGYEGSQDWDLGLRVIDQIAPEQIIHVTKILYHWRAIPGSTALLMSEKNYPVEAARRALQDHFARKGETVELQPVPGDHWRVKHMVPSPAPRIVLVIPTRDRVRLLRQCVESILAKTTYPNFEVLVVDNGSTEAETIEYLDYLRTRGVRVLGYSNAFNYSAINNFAVAQTQSELVGLLNNDLEIIHGDWLDEMVSQAVRPEIGCVGAMLYYPNDRIQHAGVIVGVGGVAGHAFRDFPRGTPGVFNRARLVQNYTAVTAACLVVRRKIYEQVGGLDEKSLAVAFNDVDFCLKVRAAGFQNLWTPFAELYHHESASRGAEDTPEKHERFRAEVETMLERWRDELDHDPAYNPNLTLELNDFSLAVPPRAAPFQLPTAVENSKV